MVLSRVGRQKMLPFLAQPTFDDLVVLNDLIETGKITPVIDRTYPLSEAGETVRYVESGHARGKGVITV